MASKIAPTDKIEGVDAEQRKTLESKLRRRIDFRLMPMVLLMNILNHLGRNTIATASLAGLRHDLKLKDNQYQLAVSILLVGYLLMQDQTDLNTKIFGIMIAFGAIFIVPNFPRTARCLTDEEEEMAIWRLERDIGEDDLTNSKEQTLLHGAILIDGTIAILINAWHADQTGERYLHIAAPPVLAFASFVIAASTIKFAPRYLAMCLMIGSIYSR
ncbi:MAG: hypothetical protein FE78DRAFT_74533 [Acidomyces sp. 'richmondensis']|nr:MAG: hypothetical protein FE78DRAFT_74533 [Acidomyces sp. 'richmondensis']